MLNACMLMFGVWLDDCAGWSVTRPVYLAQAIRPRPGETCRDRPRLTLELSLRRRAFVWARHHLAQAREARLSEDEWGLEVCVVGVAQARKPFFWARNMLAQVSSGSLKRESASLARFPNDSLA